MDWQQLFRLKCEVRYHPWGEFSRDGVEPYIASLVGVNADPGQGFAELWIGDHPQLPSHVSLGSNDTPLPDFVAAQPDEILGPTVLDMGFDTLPFLLKVLSCEMALSVQAHPDKRLAEAFHRRDPANYPDANHKPEIAIGLAGMEALCQLRRPADVRADMLRLSPLRGAFGPLASQEDLSPDEWLRHACRRIVELPDRNAAELLDDLRRTLEDTHVDDPRDDLFLRLVSQFPGDRGALWAYLLNHLHLARDHAVFLAPDEPHAYIRGTIVECMASSDNVVRAGLTGRFTDDRAFLDMLTYRAVPAPTMLPVRTEPGHWVYRVPCPEFQVELWRQEPGPPRTKHSGGLVSVLLVTQGRARLSAPGASVEAERGSVWLWPAALGGLNVTALDPVEVFRALPNPDWRT